MRANILLSYIAVTLYFMVSCSMENNIDFLGIGGSTEPRTWQEELAWIIDSHHSVLENSNLALLDYELLNGYYVEEEDFFKNENISFPIFTSTFDKCYIASYSFIKNDTTTIHYKSSYLEKYLRDIISSDIEYDIIELTWKTGDTDFKTKALFDSETGELLYDNVLFNLINMPQKEDGSRNRLLTRSEGGDWGKTYDSDFEIIYYFNENDILLGHISVYWYEWGYWDNVEIKDSIGNVIGNIRQYQHIHCDCTFNPWTNGTPFVVTRYGFNDFSADNYGKYRFFIWVGMLNDYPGEDYIYGLLDGPGGEAYVPTQTTSVSNVYQGYVRYNYFR